AVSRLLPKLLPNERANGRARAWTRISARAIPQQSGRPRQDKTISELARRGSGERSRIPMRCCHALLRQGRHSLPRSIVWRRRLRKAVGRPPTPIMSSVGWGSAKIHTREGGLVSFAKVYHCYESDDRRCNDEKRRRYLITATCDQPGRHEWAH